MYEKLFHRGVTFSWYPFIHLSRGTHCGNQVSCLQTKQRPRRGCEPDFLDPESSALTRRPSSAPSLSLKNTLQQRPPYHPKCSPSISSRTYLGLFVIVREESLTQKTEWVKKKKKQLRNYSFSPVYILNKVAILLCWFLLIMTMPLDKW